MEDILTRKTVESKKSKTQNNRILISDWFYFSSNVNKYNRLEKNWLRNFALNELEYPLESPAKKCICILHAHQFESSIQ